MHISAHDVPRLGLKLATAGLDLADAAGEVGATPDALRVARNITPASGESPALIPVAVDLPIDREIARVAKSAFAGLPIAWVLVVPPTAWQRSMPEVVRQALDGLGIASAALLLLSHVDVNIIKGGQPFSQLGRLRDAGCCRGFGAVAQSLAALRWAAEHTPSHAMLTTAAVYAEAIAEPQPAKGQRVVEQLAEDQIALFVAHGFHDPITHGPGLTSSLLALHNRTVPDVTIPRLGRPPEL